MRNTVQACAIVDEVDAVFIAVFDGGQAAKAGVLFTCGKDQRLLAAAVKQPGSLPGAGQVVMGGFQVPGVEFDAFPEGEPEYFAVAVFKVCSSFQRVVDLTTPLRIVPSRVSDFTKSRNITRNPGIVIVSPTAQSAQSTRRAVCSPAL